MQDDPSDDQPEPPPDYPSWWKSQGRIIGLVIAALVVLALVAGALLIYFLWPPPHPGVFIVYILYRQADESFEILHLKVVKKERYTEEEIYTLV